jgi:dynein heavy chain 2, cytosolic
LRNWCDALKVGDFNIRTFLASEAQLLTFKKEGLPADNLSMENAIYILNSARTPLIIDPATQATTWLKQSLEKQKESIEVLNHQDKKFNTQLELAIRFGKVLVIQEVDGIEAMLFPLLKKDFNQQGPRQVVMIGEKAVDYNPAFELYLTTRDQFVQIPPNAQPLVTNVNFTVTKSGLESQLLSITINFEKPELESKKTEILEQQDKLQLELAGYEKALLEELVSSEGNILENRALIQSLEATKQQSSQIEDALANQRQLAAALDQERNVYGNFAYTGSNLFMVIGELIKINNMYQFSLASFVKLFRRALDSRPAANSTEEKLAEL